MFLDRDGVLLRYRPYLRAPEQAILLWGAGRAVARLRRAGLAVVVVTNQSAIARGLATRREVDTVHARVRRLLVREKTKLDGLFLCPHHPDFGRPCRCRKPSDFLLRQAARKLFLDLSRSYMVGDNGSDMEAGERAGCTTVLVRTGLGRRQKRAALSADRICKNLWTASGWILRKHAEKKAEPGFRLPPE